MALGMAQTVETVRLKRHTLDAFDAYIREAEAVSQAAAAFLWCEAEPERLKPLRKGHIVAQFWGGKGPERAPDGLIHDWIGATWLENATVAQTLALIQDYDNHKNVYKPEVIESKLLSRRGSDFKIYLRLVKKKILTVVLDTWHDVHYWSNGARATCRSMTTRISEVEDAGKPNEKVLPPDAGYGFLWRLYTHWRFQEAAGGMYAECRAISLTRDIPHGLGWIIEPIVRKLPGESLITTLKATREALRPGS